MPTSPPRPGIQPSWSGLLVQGTANSPPSTIKLNIQKTGADGRARTDDLLRKYSNFRSCSTDSFRNFVRTSQHKPGSSLLSTLALRLALPPKSHIPSNQPTLPEAYALWCEPVHRHVAGSDATNGSLNQHKNARRVPTPGHTRKPSCYSLRISKNWSRWSGSNRRPTVYETVALPTELHRQETDGGIIAADVLAVKLRAYALSNLPVSTLVGSSVDFAGRSW